MNQTRAFLIFAWLMVATLLWMEWGKEQAAPAMPTTTATATSTSGDSTVPAAVNMAVPSAPAAATPGMPQASATTTATAQAVTVSTDVLRATLDGGSIRTAELLRYPQDTKRGSAPVQLLDTRPGTYFVAQSGWVSSTGTAPSHEAGFVPEDSARSYTLAQGARELSVPFVWTGANGVTIRRTYTFKRGDYAIGVRDEVINAGSAPWQGYVYRQLLRTPPLQKSGLTNPEAYSFGGAAWYSPEDKYEKRKYADFVDDGALDKQVTGGWVALLQHYFFAAWIPDAKESATFSLATPNAVDGGTRSLIFAVVLVFAAAVAWGVMVLVR